MWLESGSGFVPSPWIAQMRLNAFSAVAIAP
jgi:hypothetical protein